MKHLVFFALLLITSISYAKKISLNDYLKEVERANLNLKISDLVKKASEKDSAGHRLPSPTIGLTRREFEDDTTSTGFEVGLTLPFPTKVINEKKIREASYSQASELNHSVINTILSQARKEFYNYWIETERLVALNEKKKIYKHHIDLARSLTRSNSLMQIHLLKTQGDLDLLESEIIRQNQLISDIKVKLAEFIDKEASYEFPLPQGPKRQKIKEININEAPQIKNLEYKVKKSELENSLNSKGWIPDFKIGYMQMEESKMMPAFKQVSLAITLPFIFFGEVSAKEEKSKVKLKEAKVRLLQGRKKVEYLKYSILKQMNSLSNEIDLIEKDLIPKAKERAKIMNSIAPREMSSLKDHLETMLSLPNLRIQELALIKDYEKVVANFLVFHPSKEIFYE